jgi:hypothetical protein
VKNHKSKGGEIHIDFEASEMDEILFKWLSTGIPNGDRESFEKTLLYNRRFREHFCEWIKAIREPAWALNHNKTKDTGDGQ